MIISLRRQQGLEPRYLGWRGGIRRARAGLFAVAAVLATLLARTEVASGEERNRCGCYQDTTGACFCGKKATCGCPGDCEPRGCEEKRNKEIQRQIDEETKKAEAADRQGATIKKGQSAAERGPVPVKAPPAHQGLTPGQAKQLGKLLDLYLTEHPDAGGTSIEKVRENLSAAR